MSKDYYALYIMTGTKGLQKHLIERKPFTHFTELFDISFFISSALKYSMPLRGKIRAICWNYIEDPKKVPYPEPVYRALAFSKVES